MVGGTELVGVVRGTELVGEVRGTEPTRGGGDATDGVDGGGAVSVGTGDAAIVRDESPAVGTGDGTEPSGEGAGEAVPVVDTGEGRTEDSSGDDTEPGTEPADVTAGASSSEGAEVVETADTSPPDPTSAERVATNALITTTATAEPSHQRHWRTRPEN